VDELCYLNGQLVPLSEAKVSVLDLGMLRSFGIYEGITAVAGEPFHFDDHFDRFKISAEKLGLTLATDKATAREATRELISKNIPVGERASIRMLLTGGQAEGGIEHVPGRETFYIIAERAEPLPRAWYEEGASLITQEHQRFMPEAKTINYITAVMSQPRRKEAGAAEVLYHANGQVLECATSNIFIVKDGMVVTPSENILPGITRKVVLELAREADYPVEERAVTLAELFDADEIFITSSFKDIVPINSVDDKHIGTVCPGPVTRDLMTRFAAALLPG
jgi:D-amino acid aminotransferase